MRAPKIPEDLDSVTKAKLQFLLEVLPDAPEEVIHKVHKALEEAVEEDGRRMRAAQAKAGY